MSETILTSESAAAVRFDQVRRGGYNMAQVDAFVNMVVNALKQKPPIEEEQPVVSGANQQPVVTSEAAKEHASMVISAMLAEASTTVLETIAQAKEEAKEIEDLAKAQADQIAQDAEQKAKEREEAATLLVENSKAQADQIAQDAEQKAKEREEAATLLVEKSKADLDSISTTYSKWHQDLSTGLTTVQTALSGMPVPNVSSNDEDPQI